MTIGVGIRRTLKRHTSTWRTRNGVEERHFQVGALADSAVAIGFVDIADHGISTPLCRSITNPIIFAWPSRARSLFTSGSVVKASRLLPDDLTAAFEVVHQLISYPCWHKCDEWPRSRDGNNTGV